MIAPYAPRNSPAVPHNIRPLVFTPKSQDCTGAESTEQDDFEIARPENRRSERAQRDQSHPSEKSAHLLCCRMFDAALRYT